MKLSLDWTLENRPRPLNIRVSAEVERHTNRWTGESMFRPYDIQAQDEQGRPVDLTPEEELEVEALAVEAAEAVERRTGCEVSA